MQNFLSVLLLSVSSNLDTVTVAISYGMNKIKIPWISSLLIAIISTLGTFLSMEFGSLLVDFIPANLADLIGGLMLIVIGVWFLIDFLRKNKTVKSSYDQDLIIYENFMVDKDNSGDISIKETIPLALALTINNLGVGIAASITGISILYSTICTFIVTLISIWCGSWIGQGVASKLLGKYAPIISSILLIILGIYESFM
ncbi:MAG: sporulation membrane protein YtaF [Clostridium sp.]